MGTLLSFSVVAVVASIGALGVRVSAAEAEDYVYAWLAIGEMLGIAHDVLPATWTGRRSSPRSSPAATIAARRTGWS